MWWLVREAFQLSEDLVEAGEISTGHRLRAAVHALKAGDENAFKASLASLARESEQVVRWIEEAGLETNVNVSGLLRVRIEGESGKEICVRVGRAEFACEPGEEADLIAQIATCFGPEEVRKAAEELFGFIRRHSSGTLKGGAL